MQGFNAPGATGLTNGAQVPINFSIAAGSVMPAFTTHPANQNASVGATVTFIAAASGTPAPTYQWRKDSAALNDATGSTLVLTNVQATAAGTYTVVATNSAGAATSNGAVLTVTVPTVGPVSPPIPSRRPFWPGSRSR